MFFYIAFLFMLGCTAAQLKDCQIAQCNIEKLTMGKIEFVLKKMDLHADEDVRVLREVYVEDRTGSKHVQSTEFDVDEYADEVGYRFIHEEGVLVPSRMFMNHKVPVVIGRNVTMKKKDVSHILVEGDDFFYQRYNLKRIIGKFTCTHMMKGPVKCMVMETRFAFFIPFSATMINEKDQCQCISKGTFRRNANPTYRYVIDKLDNRSQ